MIADARIGADAEAHLLDVRAHALGEIRQLVHEADLGREHRVRRVLGQLGGAHVHHDHALAVARERIVERLEQLGGARIVGADDDAIGLHEVADRGAFLEEFRVRHHVELDLRAARLESAVDLRAHLVGSADRHRRLRDHDAVLADIAADRLGDAQHVLEIGGAVFVGRRADRDELEQAVLDAFRRVGREVEAPGGEIALEQIVQPRLVDRRLAALEHLHFALVDIHAQHVVADLGEARTRDQADVAGTEDGKTHGLTCCE